MFSKSCLLIFQAKIRSLWRRIFILWLFSLSIQMLFTQIASGSNLRFLNFAALYYLCDADFAKLFTTIDMTLNHIPDNGKTIWRNPMTGAFGYVQAFDTSFNSGYFCRSLKIYTVGRTGSGELNYRLCKVCGEWKLSRE